MSDYEEDQFEKEEHNSNYNNNFKNVSLNGNEKQHKMKLSIDFLTIRDMRVSANVLICYSLKLSDEKDLHNFKSGKATAVPQSTGINSNG